MMSKPRLLLSDEASLGLSPQCHPTVFKVVDQINDDGTRSFNRRAEIGVLP